VFCFLDDYAIFRGFTRIKKKGKQMGRMTAMEIAETELTLEDQITWHLRSNSFPPIPKSMVKPCIEAIDAANEGSWEKLISLPEGTGYRGLTVAPAHAIVETHHLETWITNEGEY
jgi:hypothetical protein